MRYLILIILMLYSKLSIAQSCQCSDNSCEEEFVIYWKRGESFLEKGDYKRARQSFLNAKNIQAKNCIDVLLKKTELASMKQAKHRNVMKPSVPDNRVKQKENELTYILPNFKEVVSETDTILIAENEVTQKEWSFFCKQKNIVYPASNPDFPITNITWNEVNEYCDWLSNKTGILFRLLTEDEWTFALGKIPSSKLDEFSWAYEPKKNPELRLHSVKSKKPNSLGLFDMLGNASEWTMDWYKDNNGAAITNDDDIGDFKLVLGCSYEDEIFLCKEILKKSFEPTYTKETIGFRICTSKN